MTRINLSKNKLSISEIHRASVHLIEFDQMNQDESNESE